MPSTILLRNIAGTDDKRIVMQNSQFARSLIVGSSWNVLRVGIRCSMRDSGASITGTPRFAVGVCSGTTNIFGDATVDNWCGVISTAATWPRGTQGGKFYYGDISARVAKKVGATLTTGGLYAFSGFIADAPLGNRVCYFVNITKGSPNYSFRLLSWSGSNSDTSQATFLSQVELASPVITDHMYYAAITLAVDEVGGLFNAVNIAWDKSSPEIEISELAVVKFS